MEPDRLFGCVAFYPLGAGVPGHDAAFGVEQVNRVFGYALNNRTQTQIVCAQLLPRLVLLGYVANNAQHRRPILGCNGLEHDVDRKLGTVFAQRPQIHGSAHLTGARMRRVVFPVLRMTATKPLRNQDLNRLPDQLVIPVTEKLCNARIGLANDPLPVGDQNPIGRKLKQVLYGCLRKPGRAVFKRRGIVLPGEIRRAHVQI